MPETQDALSADEIETMLHALGSTHATKKNPMGWRNYYNTSFDDPEMLSLVERGFMEKLGDARASAYFGVTKKGIEFVRLIGHNVVIR